MWTPQLQQTGVGDGVLSEQGQKVCPCQAAHWVQQDGAHLVAIAADGPHHRQPAGSHLEGQHRDLRADVAADLQVQDPGTPFARNDEHQKRGHLERLDVIQDFGQFWLRPAGIAHQSQDGHGLQEVQRQQRFFFRCLDDPQLGCSRSDGP